MARKALIAVTDFGIEEPELVSPRDSLRAAGFDVTVASTTGEPAQTVTSDKDWASVQDVDTALSGVSAEGYDVLVIPGGTVNADTLRIDDTARGLVKEFTEAGKTVATICHGPWILIDSGVVEGKTLTSYTSIRTDLENAGGSWVDQSVKVCPAKGWTLITSRNPGDLEDFNQAIIDEVPERA